MDSTGLLHKKINWASESGCWLMWGSVQYGSLSHSLFHSCSSIYLVSLIESDVTLIIYVSLFNPIISQIPPVLFPFFPQWGQIGFAKANAMDGQSIRLYCLYICR